MLLLLTIFGPFAPYLIAAYAAGIFAIIIGTIKGLTLLGPFSKKGREAVVDRSYAADSFLCRHRTFPYPEIQDQDPHPLQRGLSPSQLKCSILSVRRTSFVEPLFQVQNSLLQHRSLRCAGKYRENQAYAAFALLKSIPVLLFADSDGRDRTS